MPSHTSITGVIQGSFFYAINLHRSCAAGEMVTGAVDRIEHVSCVLSFRAATVKKGDANWQHLPQRVRDEHQVLYPTDGRPLRALEATDKIN